jgi:hypothetical protein
VGGRQFELLPFELSEAWLLKFGLQKIEFLDLGLQLEHVSEKNGWRHLCQKDARGFLPKDPDPFEWNKRRFEVKTDHIGQKVEISLLSLDAGNDWHVSLVKFDASLGAMTSKEAENMAIPWNKGHPKKR